MRGLELDLQSLVEDEGAQGGDILSGFISWGLSFPAQENTSKYPQLIRGENQNPPLCRTGRGRGRFPGWETGHDMARMSPVSRNSRDCSSELLMNLLLVLVRLQLQLVGCDLPILVAVLVLEHVGNDFLWVGAGHEAAFPLRHLGLDEGGELERGEGRDAAWVCAASTGQGRETTANAKDRQGLEQRLPSGTLPAPSSTALGWGVLPARLCRLPSAQGQQCPSSAALWGGAPVPPFPRAPHHLGPTHLISRDSPIFVEVHLLVQAGWWLPVPDEEVALGNPLLHGDQLHLEAEHGAARHPPGWKYSKGSSTMGSKAKPWP